MTKTDLNGNTTGNNRVTLSKHVRACCMFYHTDAHGRIMVDTKDGGCITFFAQDEPHLAEWVRNNLHERVPGEENRPQWPRDYHPSTATA